MWLNFIVSEIGRKSGGVFEGTETFVIKLDVARACLASWHAAFQTQMCPPSALQLRRLPLPQKPLRPHCPSNLLNNGRNN